MEITTVIAPEIGVGTGKLAGLAWRTSKVSTNGIEIAIEETGPVDGEPLLLIMGLGGQATLWPDNLCADLAGRGFRVIRFDNRDIGLSGSGNRGIKPNIPRAFLRRLVGLAAGPVNYDLYDMAADTVGVLDALGFGFAHVVGISMGGMIAQLVAGTYPERVKSLTSIMSSTNNPRIRQSRLDLLLRLARPRRVLGREDAIDQATDLFQRIGSPGYRIPEAERREAMGRAYDRAYRPAGAMRQLHAIVATGSFEDVLPKISAPTTVIHGRADPLVRPVCGERCARLIPGARLELIDGMGHDAPPALMPRWASLIAATAARAGV